MCAFHTSWTNSSVNPKCHDKNRLSIQNLISWFKAAGNYGFYHKHSMRTVFFLLLLCRSINGQANRCWLNWVRWIISFMITAHCLIELTHTQKKIKTKLVEIWSRFTLFLDHILRDEIFHWSFEVDDVSHRELHSMRLDQCGMAAAVVVVEQSVRDECVLWITTCDWVTSIWVQKRNKWTPLPIGLDDFCKEIDVEFDGFTAN